MGIKAAWNALLGRAPTGQPAAPGPGQVEQLKATLYIQEPDGWIPAIQFSGSDLSTLLTQGLWAYICATRIADDIAAMPGVVQTREPGTDKWSTDSAHPLNKLLRRPYGASMAGMEKPPFDWSQMLQAASIRLDFNGNAFFRERSILGERLEALQLIQGTVTAKEDPSTGVAVAYRVNGSDTLIPASQMTNVMLYTAGSYWDSPSTLDAVTNATQIDYTAQQRLKYDLEHRIAPGAVIKVKGYFVMDDDTMARTKTVIEDGYEGAANAGKSLIVGDNTTVEAPPSRNVDDLATHRKTARDEIISGFHVAPPVVGVLDQAKYANYHEALRAHWAFCIRPRLARIYNPINTQAIEPIYGPDVRLWYELAENELGLAVLDARAGTAQKLVDLGHPTANASERVGLGMPRFDGDDQPLQNLALAGRESGAADGDEPPAEGEPMATDGDEPPAP